VSQSVRAALAPYWAQALVGFCHRRLRAWCLKSSGMSAIHWVVVSLPCGIVVVVSVVVVVGVVSLVGGLVVVVVSVVVVVPLVAWRVVVVIVVLVVVLGPDDMSPHRQPELRIKSVSRRVRRVSM